MTVRFFVNEQTATADEGSDILSAVTLFDESLGNAVREGRAYVTDGVGLTIDPAGPVTTGAILRVVVSARRPGSGGSSA